MNNVNELSTAKKLTYFAILTALTVVLQLWASAINIGIATLNFSLVPLVLCGMILGVWYATALGAIVGVVILIPIFMGQSWFSPVFMETPIMIILLCLVKTGLAGFLGALLYRALRNKNKYLATFVSAGIVPTINTLIFIIWMFMISGVLTSIYPLTEGQTLFNFIVISLVGLNFPLEFAVNLLLAPAIFRVISAMDKQIGAEI